MNILAQFRQIRCFVFDMDGVLTDGTLILYHHGHMLRQMHIKDGYGLQLAVKKGYKVIVVSGSHSEASRDRLERLGIKDIRMEVKDKGAELAGIMKQYSVSADQVLYMGDDMPDLPALRMAGMPCCPADAVAEVKEACKYISPVSGGLGCVRDVIEKVLKMNSHWNEEEGIASV